MITYNRKNNGCIVEIDGKKQESVSTKIFVGFKFEKNGKIFFKTSLLGCNKQPALYYTIKDILYIDIYRKDYPQKIDNWIKQEAKNIGIKKCIKTKTPAFGFECFNL